MKKALCKHISRISLIFSAAVIAATLSNLLNGHLNKHYYYLLELFGFVIAIEAVYSLLAKIPFKSKLIYSIVNFSIMYLIFMIFSYFGSWLSFTISGFMLSTGIFLVIYGIISYYYSYTLKKDAIEINEKLTSNRQ